MKLVLYVGVSGFPHHKNYEAIQRMCNTHNIEFEVSSNLNRLVENNYNILLTCFDFIDPEIIPENIKIIYGPQFFILPSGPIVNKLNDKYKDRCVFNCLSNWIKELYLECVTDFIVPIIPLPFSVNTNQFKQLEHQTKEYDCLLYIKRRSNDLINFTLSLLNQKGLVYKIFRYGSYNEQEYINALQKSKFMISLDAHESQGFALEEAMSSGIPLLVMDATSMYDETDNGITATYDYLKPKLLRATSVPYWSDECGIKIEKKEELHQALDNMLVNYKKFTPRDYIIRTLSDEVCMKRILDYFKLYI